MSTSTKLGDKFLRIPKLEVSGTNWVIFKDRFTWALDARSILDHIDGSAKEPKDPIPAAIREKISETPLDRATLREALSPKRRTTRNVCKRWLY